VSRSTAFERITQRSGSVSSRGSPTRPRKRLSDVDCVRRFLDAGANLLVGELSRSRASQNRQVTTAPQSRQAIPPRALAPAQFWGRLSRMEGAPVQVVVSKYGNPWVPSLIDESFSDREGESPFLFVEFALSSVELFSEEGVVPAPNGYLGRVPQVGGLLNRHPHSRDRCDELLGCLTSLRFVEPPHRLQAEVPSVGDRPLIVLLCEDHADQPEQRLSVGEDPHDVDPPLHLLVQPLQGVVTGMEERDAAWSQDRRGCLEAPGPSSTVRPSGTGASGSERRTGRPLSLGGSRARVSTWPALRLARMRRERGSVGVVARLSSHSEEPEPEKGGDHAQMHRA
jgi:hypothetical protein